MRRLNRTLNILLCIIVGFVPALFVLHVVLLSLWRIFHPVFELFYGAIQVVGYLFGILTIFSFGLFPVCLLTALLGIGRKR